jgi:putative inorganic carbon (HCO3(-)) transporter
MNKRYSLSFYTLIILTFILLGRPQDFFFWLAPLRLALAFTFITLATTIFGKKRSTWNVIFNSSEGKKYILLYLIMILGIPFALYRYLAFDSVLGYSVNILFFFFCLIQINTIEKLKAMIFTTCCSALFYSTLSLTMSEPGSERFSYGTMYDPNDLAYVLVSLLPLSIYFITQKNYFIKRMFGLATIGVSLITIFLTGSRGGFLGLISIIMLLIFTKVTGINRPQKIALVIISIVLFAIFGNTGDKDRYKSLMEVSSDYNVTSEEGRISLWRMGIGVALSHPVTGVGVNCSAQAIGDLRVTRGELSSKWQTVHNSFIEIAAETGLIGFILFNSMIIGTFKRFSLYRKSEITSPHAKEFQYIAAALQFGFIGSLVAAFFLSQAYSFIFALFFALSAVMKNIARIQSVQSVQH